MVTLTIIKPEGIHIRVEREIVLTITAELFCARYTPVRNGQDQPCNSPHPLWVVLVERLK
jgi:hypothetical protein